MKIRSCKYEEAFELVASKRPNLKITETFVPFLKDLLNDNPSGSKRSQRSRSKAEPSPKKTKQNPPHE